MGVLFGLIVSVSFVLGNIAFAIMSDLAKTMSSRDDFTVVVSYQFWFDKAVF